MKTPVLLTAPMILMALGATAAIKSLTRDGLLAASPQPATILIEELVDLSRFRTWKSLRQRSNEGAVELYQRP
jgi:hypothetical protein